MSHLVGKEFECATLFEFGTATGIRQLEIKGLRFGRAVDGHLSAQFVIRGKRKTQHRIANRMVIIEGWEHPALEVWEKEESSDDLLVRRLKYTLFSPEWDVLLDEYLQRVNPGVIFDGRVETASLTHLPSTRPQISPNPAQNDQGEKITFPEEIQAAELFIEGAATQVQVNKYERSPAARHQCLSYHGYACKACGCEMGDTYGELGRHYMHVHHVVPLSEIGENYEVDPIKDLIPVCPNCHSMLHRKKEVISVDKLRAIIAANRR